MTRSLSALEATRIHRPEVLVMDIRMPVMDGIAATREVVATGLPTRVLILTTYDIAEHVRRPPPRSGVPEQLQELREREREVLVLVARGLSNEDIAATLMVTLATVKTHVNRILTKLGLRSRVQAVASAGV